MAGNAAGLNGASVKSVPKIEIGVDPVKRVARPDFQRAIPGRNARRVILSGALEYDDHFADPQAEFGHLGPIGSLRHRLNRAGHAGRYGNPQR